MALERIFPRLRSARRVEPFDSYAAFDAGRRVAFVVGHARHRSCHELQGRLPPLPRFDARGRRGGGQVRELVDVQGPGSHRYDELGGREGEREWLVGQRYLDGWIGRSGEVVDVQCRVPGA